jgi:ABC-type xylose transport system substrate-binding protein
MRTPHAMSDAEADFKAAVKAYIALHDQLATASKELRNIRKKKTELADTIVSYMKANDIGECELQDGKLIHKKSKRMEPLKKEHILEELVKSMGDTQAEDVLVSIFGKRHVQEKDHLTRTRKR